MNQPKANPRIIVRSVRPEDAADLHAIISHPQVARTLIHLPTMELAETEAWIARKTPGRYRLVAEIDGRVVGSCPLTHNQRPRMQHSGRLGLMVHVDYWGQGVGSALLAAVLELADNWLNLRRMELEVMTHNAAATHLYEKFGFRSEGIRRRAVFGDGQWQDEMVMARLRDTAGLQVSHTPPPPPPGRVPDDTPVEIRAVRPADLPGIYAILTHPLVDRTTLQLPWQDWMAFMDRIGTPRPEVNRVVAAAGEKVVGMASLHHDQNPRMNHSAGLGMSVHPDYWGRGVGSQLMAALLDLADNWLHLQRVDLQVNTDNPAAIYLYEKFGFVIEGTCRFHTYGDGRWADSHFMARLRHSGYSDH